VRVRHLVVVIGAVLVLAIASPAGASATTNQLGFSNQAFPGTQVQPTGVSCTSLGQCVAIDYNGDIYQVSGAQSELLAATGHYLFAVSCPTISFCMAVGNDDALTLRPGGIAPYLLNYPNPKSAVHWESVSCSSSTFCMAGGGIVDGPHAGAGVVASWDGFVWSRVRVVDPFLPEETHTFISSMSCPTRTFCVAADGNQRTLQWNGRSWFFPRALNALNVSFSISCTSSTYCLAVTYQTPAYLIWNGKRWAYHPGRETDPRGAYVSCSTQTFCVALDWHGAAAEWNGSSWGPLQLVNPTDTDVTAISCSTAMGCEAVSGRNHFVYLYSRDDPPKTTVVCSRFGCGGHTI
jgi:hypothetical protein